MKKENTNINTFEKVAPSSNENKAEHAKATSYSYYSNVLKKPFEKLNDLTAAEQLYFDSLKAKEEAATQKKTDAKQVEEAFKALNRARKDYKDNLIKITDTYQNNLNDLKKNFEAERTAVQTALADAESRYAAVLKAFTEKYPEGYHLTLKDGDFETTISGSSTAKESTGQLSHDFSKLVEWFFRNI